MIGITTVHPAVAVEAVPSEKRKHDAHMVPYHQNAAAFVGEIQAEIGLKEEVFI